MRDLLFDIVLNESKQEEKKKSLREHARFEPQMNRKL